MKFADRTIADDFDTSAIAKLNCVIYPPGPKPWDIPLPQPHNLWGLLGPKGEETPEDIIDRLIKDLEKLKGKLRGKSGAGNHFPNKFLLPPDKPFPPIKSLGHK